MVYIRVVHSSSRNIGVAEPFVVRLESELEQSVSATQFKEFSNVHPIIQVFYTDGRLYTLLSPEFYKIHSIVYANNACTVHIVFNAIPNYELLKFQTQFRWEFLKLFTVTEAFTITTTAVTAETEKASSPDFVDTLLSGKKRKRAEYTKTPAAHEKTWQEQIAVLHDQVALMREEILGYRSLFNDTLLKYVKPMERSGEVLPPVNLNNPIQLWGQLLLEPDVLPPAQDGPSFDVFEFMRDAVI